MWLLSLPLRLLQTWFQSLTGMYSLVPTEPRERSFFVRHMNKNTEPEDFEMREVWFLFVPTFKGGFTASTGRCSVLNIDCSPNC